MIVGSEVAAFNPLPVWWRCTVITDTTQILELSTLHLREFRVDACATEFHTFPYVQARGWSYLPTFPHYLLGHLVCACVCEKERAVCRFQSLCSIAIYWVSRSVTKWEQEALIQKSLKCHRHVRSIRTSCVNQYQQCIIDCVTGTPIMY